MKKRFVCKKNYVIAAILFPVNIKKLLIISITLLFFFGIGLIIFLFQTIPQAKTFPRTDALLLHSYWLSQKGNGPVTLSLRSELEVKAAYLLYKKHKVTYLVITDASIWGKNYPTIGKVMQQELIRFGVPPDKIILKETAMDTYEEVTVFLQIARQHHFTSLSDLAAYEHLLVIPQLFKVQENSPLYFSVEQVIHTFGDASDKQTIQELSHSIYTIGFGLYELAVRATLVFDPRYHLLTQHAHATRNHKSPYGSILFFPVDKYEL